MIRHVITWRLVATDPDEKAAAFDVLADGFGALPAVIPEIKSLWIGRDLGETPGNWDVTLIIDYDSTADLETYQNHPAHEKVKGEIRDLLAERTAVDFEL